METDWEQLCIEWSIMWGSIRVQSEWAIITLCPQMENEKISHLYVRASVAELTRTLLTSSLDLFSRTGPSYHALFHKQSVTFTLFLVFLLIASCAAHWSWSPPTIFSLRPHHPFHASLCFVIRFPNTSVKSESEVANGQQTYRRLNPKVKLSEQVLWTLKTCHWLITSKNHFRVSWM